MNIHVTGIDTTNSDLINTFLNNIIQSFPTCDQFGFNVVDATTLDISLTLGV